MELPETLLDVRTIGAKREDQFFILNGVGAFNVSAINAHFYKAPDDFLRVLQPLTTEMIRGVREGHDVDDEYLATLGADHVAAGWAIGIRLVPDGDVRLIDGTHYILKAAQMREKTVRVVVVPPELVDQFRIRFQGCILPGVWFDLSIEEMSKRMIGIYARRDGTIVDTRGGGRVVRRRAAS